MDFEETSFQGLWVECCQRNIGEKVCAVIAEGDPMPLGWRSFLFGGWIRLA